MSGVAHDALRPSSLLVRQHRRRPLRQDVVTSRVLHDSKPLWRKSGRSKPRIVLQSFTPSAVVRQLDRHGHPGALAPLPASAALRKRCAASLLRFRGGRVHCVLSISRCSLFWLASAEDGEPRRRWRSTASAKAAWACVVAATASSAGELQELSSAASSSATPNSSSSSIPCRGRARSVPPVHSAPSGSTIGVEVRDRAIESAAVVVRNLSIISLDPSAYVYVLYHALRSARATVLPAGLQGRARLPLPLRVPPLLRCAAGCSAGCARR